MPGSPRFSMTPGLAACGYVVPVGGNPDVGARTRTERGCNPGPTSGCLPKNDNPRLHARRLLAAQRPGATPVAVQGPLLEPGGSTFRTCGSPTAQVAARSRMSKLCRGWAEFQPQKRRGRHYFHPTDQFVAGMSRLPTQKKAAEVTNADIAFERATRCVAALLGDAGPCGGKRLSPITHATTGVHKAQGVRTALHNRPAPPSRA